MAFKLTLKDYLGMFLSKNITESKLSIAPNKKFSDIKTYVESGKFGSSLAGRVSKQVDNGYVYVYEYIMNNNTREFYRVTIQHFGEKVTMLEFHRRCAGATGWVKNSLNYFEKKVPNIPAGEKIDEKIQPMEDYSGKSLSELVNVFDKNLTAFSKNATVIKLDELIRIKEAIADKVNQKPIAERAPFNKAIANINTYLEALKMQMNSCIANPTQFVGTYLPQIQTALSELAALLG